MTDLSGPAYDAMIESGKALAAKMFAYGVKLYFNHHGATVASAQAMIGVIDLALAAETARAATAPKVDMNRPDIAAALEMEIAPAGDPFG